MSRLLKKIIKFILILVIIIAGLGFIKNALTPVLTPTRLIAIVHNNQDIGRFYGVFDNYKVDILDLDTSNFTDEQIRDQIEIADGVIFAGGNDFDPALYGGDSDLVEDFDTEDDRISLRALDMCIAANKPVLGICRGLQLINIYYGGSLYEDIPSQYSTDVVHRTEDGWIARHEITILPGNRLAEMSLYPDLAVNSYHHEAIKDLASGLVVTARSNDGIIEAIENPYYPYMQAYQWHPEISYGEDDLSSAIFNDFISYINRNK